MTPSSVADVRAEARRRLPRVVFDFVDGGADDEVTLRRNTEAFDGIAFRPRVLVDVSRRDLGTVILGRRLELPVIFGPAGLQGLVHRAGEPAAARAAHAAGTVYVLSAGSSYPLESVRSRSDGPLWFQLYLWGDRSRCEELVERAQRSGYAALCVTVDAPVGGNRRRDARNGMSIPFRLRPRMIAGALRRPRWLPTAYASLRTHTGNLPLEAKGATGAIGTAEWTTRMMNPAATWAELEWLRRIWQGPLVVKGILAPEDARRAAAAGADAVVVSNHGGRQLDGAITSIEALPDVVDAVGDEVEVLLDSGIRRGGDVVKALAIGARACLVARPYLFGLAAGPGGPGRVLEIYRAEIDRTLALLGVPRVDALDRSCVHLPAERAAGESA
jgi:isopentenyl diphosphate isomerase/L-lactate dehydrogenase-like FMN-dependent dehydrogenase